MDISIPSDECADLEPMSCRPQTRRSSQLQQEHDHGLGLPAIPMMSLQTKKLKQEHDGGPTLMFKPGTTWKLAYQRNNKSKEQKNLRCFPNCSVGSGHQDGFCGQSITVVFDFLKDSVETTKILAVGEFAVESSVAHPVGSIITLEKINDHGTEEDAKRLCYVPGQRLPGSKISSRNQSGNAKRTASAASFATTTSSSSSISSSSDFLDVLGSAYSPPSQRDPQRGHTSFEFNRTLKGWHYGFLGSKKTRNMYHVFRAYVLEKVTNEKGRHVPPTKQLYKVLATCRSPPWQMYCRRRKYNQIVQKRSNSVISSSPSAAIEAERRIQEQLTQEAESALLAKEIGSGNRKVYLRRADSRQRLRESNRGTNFSVKRRPQALDIPAPRDRSRKKRGSNGSSFLDIGSISLDQIDPQIPSGLLSTSSRMLEQMREEHLRKEKEEGELDPRFSKILEAIMMLDMPQPLAPHKFSMSSTKTDDFSSIICEYLRVTQEVQKQGFPKTPKLPFYVLEHLSFMNGLRNQPPLLEVSPEEQFAAFILQNESFHEQTQEFSEKHGPDFTNLDSYTTSVFALKLFTDLFQEFLIHREYHRMIRQPNEGSQLNGYQCQAPPDRSPPALASVRGGNDSHGSDFLDISVTPRAIFQQDEFDMLQPSLQTPTAASLFPTSMYSGKTPRFADEHGISSAPALSNSGCNNSSSSGSNSANNTNCKGGNKIIKGLSTLTPSSSFIFTPKDSFIFSPQNGLALSRFLADVEGGKAPADFDFMSIPTSPSAFKSSPLFAQVNNFLDETKGMTPPNRRKK